MIITRYLSKEIAQALITVTLVLMLIFLCQQTLRYLNYVTMGKFPVAFLFQLIGYEIPFLLAILLPLGLYLAILLAYGRLYSDSEMQVMQASGFGPLPLLKFTTGFALLIAILVWILAIWINPQIALKREQALSTHQATDHLIQTLSPGRFQTGLGGYVVYVEKLSRDRKQANNIFIAEEKKDPEKSAWTLILANGGYQTKDPKTGSHFFVAAEGNRYEGTPGQNDFKMTAFKKYALRLPTVEEHAINQEQETMPMTALWQHYDNPDYAAEFQWRLSSGLSVILLALLAIPLCRSKPRQGRFVTLLPAILIYIIYLNLLFAARRLTVQHWINADTGLWWVHGILLLVIVLLMRVNIRK